jgi:hypothetical protein
MSSTELARAYVRFAHASKGSPEHEANFWAFDALLGASISDPARAWEEIKNVVRCEATIVVFKTLAAGPVEELLVQHGEACIDAIERDAKSMPQLRELFGGVWRSDIKEDVWRRIEALRTRKW